MDGDGNLFIADTGNNRVRKVSAATGVITTVALVAAPTGMEIDADGNLYIADPSGNKVRKVEGVAAAAAAPTPTPTPIPGLWEWSLVVLAGLFVAVLLFRLRRRPEEATSQ